LNERERHELIREFGSIKKIVELTPSQLETRVGKTVGDSAPRTISKHFETETRPRPEPLIVPIRFVELDGAAETSFPIEARLSAKESHK
jgi:hypothetical protein